MTYHDLSHNSPEWYAFRIGKATASKFDCLITPTGKISTQIDGYISMILAEMIMGQSLEKFEQSYWMEQGSLKEADARAAYQFETDFTLDRGGVFTNEKGTIAASPDVRVFEGSRLVGGAEIKCPAPWTHVENLRRMYRHNAIDPKYKPQVQGQLLICDFEFVDWYSFHEEMPPALIRTYRDDEYIKTLQGALDVFDEKMEAEIFLLKSKGVIFPEIKPPVQTETNPNYMAG
jgi:hypothetical protein